MRGPNWIFKPPNLFLDAEGRRRQLRYEDQNLLPTNRALRMAASADGRRLGFGWLGFTKSLPELPAHTEVLSIWQVSPNRRLWSARPIVGLPPALPNPAADSPETAKTFRVAPDALVPGYADEGREVLNAGGPGRVAWSGDGAFAVVGTDAGQLLRVEQDGKLGWSNSIPVAEIKSLPTPPAAEVAGLPIFQGGRIPGGEHAYVGDIWVIKVGRSAVLVDAGGTSGFSLTQARLRALGVDQVTHVLHTHSHGDHCGGAYLWRALGAKMVGPKPAEFTLTWLMPMLTDYGIYPPRPWDVPLRLTAIGDETDFELSGLKFHALFVPGHSFDHTVYMTELNGKRIAFTADLGFENQDILNRCWGDEEKARTIVQMIRDRLVPWRPDVVFTGHGVRPDGTGFLTELIRQTDASLVQLSATPKK